MNGRDVREAEFGELREMRQSTNETRKRIENNNENECACEGRDETREQLGKLNKKQHKQRAQN
jgi:hypothetical protein